jgi:hypothetical protein
MKTITVPDFGDSGSLYQQVEVPEPGDPGYTGARLPESDPLAKYVNPAMDAAECQADLEADLDEYVTKVSAPDFGDGGVQRLHNHMKEPGPETEPEPEAAQMNTPGYEARAREPLTRPELYGLTPEQAAAEYQADMSAESYADRWQAFAESGEPEGEPEPEA